MRNWLRVGCIAVTLIILAILWTAMRLFRHDDSAIERAAMKADLRNVVIAEEAYWQRHRAYTADPQSPDLGVARYVPTDGISVRIERADSAGWSATAWSRSAPQWTCAIWVGDVAKPDPAGEEGQPACRRT